jgi:exodeoxyribonuclease VII large subunit
MMAQNSTQRQIYTVSSLTAEIKNLLETRYPLVWVTGEISNFRVPGSGHFYFTLKDAQAQIQSVMFRGQNRVLKFLPEDGMRVTGFGRVNVYEPRGAYQIIFEYLEQRGAGSLQMAFEQLKARLADEGLFDADRKKPIPFLPRKIGVVTSGTGAVIHDIIRVTGRRFPNMPIEIAAVKVQGAGAEAEIADGIRRINAHGQADVIILARGGGSLEDFHAFNSETVARAVAASQIPVISGVGHETDFTIADFTADLRAPTPSAAAELAVPLKTDLVQRVSALSHALMTRFSENVARRRTRTENLTTRLVHPRRAVADFRLRLDDLTGRLVSQYSRTLKDRRERLLWRIENLRAAAPSVRTETLRNTMKRHSDRLVFCFKLTVNERLGRIQELTARLKALDPSAILARGYSITRTVPEGRIVREAAVTKIGQVVEVRLASGSIRCRIEEIKD